MRNLKMPYMLVCAFINYAFFAQEMTLANSNENDRKTSTTSQQSVTSNASLFLNAMFSSPKSSKSQLKYESFDEKISIEQIDFNQEEEIENSKFYSSHLANKWLSLIGAIMAVLSMIVVDANVMFIP